MLFFCKLQINVCLSEERTRRRTSSDAISQKSFREGGLFSAEDEQLPRVDMRRKRNSNGR